MIDSLVLMLRRDVAVRGLDKEGPLIVEWSGMRWTLNRPAESYRHIFGILAGEGAEKGEISAKLADAGFSDGEKELDYLLERLFSFGLVRMCLNTGEMPFADVIPLTSMQPYPIVESIPEEKLILSRFAMIRRHGCYMIMESPLFPGAFILHDTRAVALLNYFRLPAEYPGIPHSDLDDETFERYIRLLVSARILCTVDSRGLAQEDRKLALLHWDVHDLAFHARSRMGRHIHPSGATLRFNGFIEPPPARVEREAEETIALEVPDLERMKKDDPSFAAVSEGRKSRRNFGGRELTFSELGEFLYRCGRTRDAADGGGIEITSRPYPNAGSLYELDIYLAVSRCQNVGKGLYRYDPDEHSLQTVSGHSRELDLLLKEASSNMISADAPPVLFILSARFRRVGWKYESIAYSLILKDTGVLLHQMSLAAEAMRMASCIIGSGNSDLFARAAGTDYFSESSVGEFVLGAMPEDNAGQ